MNFEDKKQEIEAAFVKAVDAARVFNNQLVALRSIEFPPVEEIPESDRAQAIEMGRDLDGRVAFLLRSLLVQHGNVLFI